MKRKTIAIAAAAVSGVAFVVGFGLCAWAANEMAANAHKRFDRVENGIREIDARLARLESRPFGGSSTFPNSSECGSLFLAFGAKPEDVPVHIRRRRLSLPGMEVFFSCGTYRHAPNCADGLMKLKGNSK